MISTAESAKQKTCVQSKTSEKELPPKVGALEDPRYRCKDSFLIDRKKPFNKSWNKRTMARAEVKRTETKEVLEASDSLVALTSFFSIVFSFSVLAPPALVREDDRQTAILRSQRAPIVTAIAVVRGQPPFNYNLPKNTPFHKREKEKDGRGEMEIIIIKFTIRKVQKEK
ncbi:hypothetical protein ALC53_11305 [Atta colombica]|uniref:Uncharacterized protein n=1 Tax=Atta colombica TaxID=520822 RepID=A0A195B1W5_9HYME|nr:hypothetical protein ALC53_11305 [Atta colombica]